MGEEAAAAAAAPAAAPAEAPAQVESALGGEPSVQEGQSRATTTEGEPPAEKPAETGATFESIAEGVTDLNPEIFAEFKGIAEELGLTADQAKKFLDLQAKLNGTPEEQQAEYQQAVQAQAAKWGEELKALPEIGGANFEASKAQASKVMQLATPEFRAFLNQTGLGNHPMLFQFIHTLSTKMSEGTMINSGHTPAGAGQRRSNAEVFYPPKN